MGDFKELERIAKDIRKDILIMLNKAKSGHSGGSLSIVDILVALYFGGIMNYDPKNPSWEDRDRLVLSKGHACPALYATLARAGFFERKLLWSLRRLGSPLQGHPDANKLNGIDASTGSLGNGITQAVGMALAAKVLKKRYKVFCIMGDGELQEGVVWEAFMAAAHYKLSNLIVIVDYNGLQIDGAVTNVMNINPLKDKLEAFGFKTHEIGGHVYKNLIDTLITAKRNVISPTAIIARTVKGYGVSFMANRVEYHGIPPTDDELEKALKELDNGV
ncbi:transketolase [Hippea jasoniae]|uniref:transketolase n=1 Tax=Hippea jasoniae TaxID=944479 RepID=UPI000554E792|nr:transketolase [Hippea jasoniae]